MFYVSREKLLIVFCLHIYGEGNTTLLLDKNVVRIYVLKVVNC